MSASDCGLCCLECFCRDGRCCGSSSTSNNPISGMFLLFGCACIIVLAGPVLLITGIIFLLLPNNRGDLVGQYNSAVAAYEPSGVASWVPATVNTLFPALVVTEPIALSGDTDGIVKTGVSTFLRASIPLTNHVTFNISNVVGDGGSGGGGSQGQLTVTGMPIVRTFVASVRCNYDSGCFSYQMENRCKSLYGAAASYSGSGCWSAGSCGACSYQQYLADVCIVLTATAPFTRHQPYQSCYFPFGAADQRYSKDPQSAAPSYMTATVRKADDPFMVLQRVTEGSHEFGMTEAKQRTLGIVFVVLGVVISALLLLGVCWACFRRNGSGGNITYRSTPSVAVVPPTASTPLGGVGEGPPLPPPSSPGPYSTLYNNYYGKRSGVAGGEEGTAMGPIVVDPIPITEDRMAAAAYGVDTSNDNNPRPSDDGGAYYGGGGARYGYPSPDANNATDQQQVHYPSPPLAPSSMLDGGGAYYPSGYTHIVDNPMMTTVGGGAAAAPPQQPPPSYGEPFPSQQWLPGSPPPPSQSRIRHFDVNSLPHAPL